LREPERLNERSINGVLFGLAFLNQNFDRLPIAYVLVAVLVVAAFFGNCG
jgi:hypothetical protein